MAKKDAALYLLSIFVKPIIARAKNIEFAIASVLVKKGFHPDLAKWTVISTRYAIIVSVLLFIISLLFKMLIMGALLYVLIRFLLKQKNQQVVNMGGPTPQTASRRYASWDNWRNSPDGLGHYRNRKRHR